MFKTLRIFYLFGVLTTFSSILYSFSIVLEMISAFEKAAGKKIAWQFTDRRPGDVTALYCDPKMARDLLNWETKRTVDDMCADTWRFQSENPFGYSTENKE